MDYTNYTSPFSWRYGSKEMRTIFSELHKYQIWRRIWVALAEAEHKAGIVSQAELNDLLKHQNNIDINRILEIEKDTDHDVVAAIREYAEKATNGGGKIHAGATSMDIVDNTQVIQMKEGLEIVREKLIKTLHGFAKRIDEYADLPCIAYTHLQPAEPTTVGYRFAFYAQDLLENLKFIDSILCSLKSKGLKGAVGTSASYTQLLDGTKTSASKLEEDVMKRLTLNSFLITSQTYPRQQDYIVMTALSMVAGSLAKYASDLRILQSPANGEWSEPFGKKQVGSSAMPFKKNPRQSEKICSLARYVTHLPSIALENANHSYLERTLDDSANKRIIFPEAFLAVDEILDTSSKLINGMMFNESRIKQNLENYAPFIASESIMMKAVKKGASRQDMHELLKSISLVSWTAVTNGEANPMTQILLKEKKLLEYVSTTEITSSFDVKLHIGDAPQRARKLVAIIRSIK